MSLPTLVSTGLELLKKSFKSFCTERGRKFFDTEYDKILSRRPGKQLFDSFSLFWQKYVKTLVGDEYVLNALVSAILSWIFLEVLKHYMRRPVWLRKFVATSGNQLTSGGDYSTYNDPDGIAVGGGHDTTPSGTVVDGLESPSSTDTNVGEIVIHGRESVVTSPTSSSIHTNLGWRSMHDLASVAGGPSNTNTVVGGSAIYFWERNFIYLDSDRTWLINGIEIQPFDELLQLCPSVCVSIRFQIGNLRPNSNINTLPPHERDDHMFDWFCISPVYPLSTVNQVHGVVLQEPTRYFGGYLKVEMVLILGTDARVYVRVPVRYVQVKCQPCDRKKNSLPPPVKRIVDGAAFVAADTMELVGKILSDDYDDSCWDSD